MATNALQRRPRQKVSAAWPAWGLRLAAALARLEEDHYLVISTKHGNQYVQFSGQGAFGMRAETTSNHYRQASEKLGGSQVRALLGMGWNAPSGSADQATPERDPDGSPNYFLDFAAPVDFAAVAELAVRTLVEVLRVPHPGWLQYNACGEDGAPLLLPEPGLKLARDPAADDSPEDAHQLLLDTLCEETGIADLRYDRDGDIALRYGSALLFARLVDSLPSVRICSPLLKDVEERPGLYERLNDINAHSLLMRFVYQNDGIWAVADVGAEPFDSGLVARTFRYCCELADDMGTSLQGEFGGQTCFPASMPSALRH